MIFEGKLFGYTVLNIMCFIQKDEIEKFPEGELTLFTKCQTVFTTDASAALWALMSTLRKQSTH